MLRLQRVVMTRVSQCHHKLLKQLKMFVLLLLLLLLTNVLLHYCLWLNALFLSLSFSLSQFFFFTLSLFLTFQFPVCIPNFFFADKQCVGSKNNQKHLFLHLWRWVGGGLPLFVLIHSAVGNIGRIQSALTACLHLARAAALACSRARRLGRATCQDASRPRLAPRASRLASSSRSLSLSARTRGCCCSVSLKGDPTRTIQGGLALD